MEVEKEIEQIKLRNLKVESDKAWETSFARRFYISALTYFFAAVWLYFIKDSAPFLKALVPAIGFIFSTLSLPLIKRWWIDRQGKNAN